MRTLVAAVLILLPSAASAQTAQPWPTLFISAPLADGWIGSGEVINRVNADSAGPSQLETRLELGRTLSKHVTVWAGYVHVVTYHADQRNGIENQAVEQANWAIGMIGPVRIASRTRLEQRFQRGADATGWRLREQLRLTLSLAPHQPALVAWAEPFVALNRTTGQPRTFDQLRAFAGVAIPVGARADVEIGYLHQYQHRPVRDIDTDAIPLILSLRF